MRKFFNSVMPVSSYRLIYISQVAQSPRSNCIHMVLLNRKVGLVKVTSAKVV
jgi:hypothetical protein